MAKLKRGGFRPGAGAPKKAKTVVRSYRCYPEEVSAIKAAIKEIIKKLRIMKTLILLLISASTYGQYTGTFSMNGVIITRTDSTEVSDYNGKLDTCRVTWLSDKVYRVYGCKGAATARIYKSGTWGYRAKVTDGKKTVWVELIRFALSHAP